jgi:diguanylate cyclase (GGDEF)-like protein
VDRLGNTLARAERQKSKVAVLFIDLDNLKTINDSLGHECGDRLLRSVTKRVRACLRAHDTFGRWGGDEFVVLLEGIQGPTDALKTADKIIEELKSPFDLGGQEVVTSVSIGISIGGSRLPRSRTAAADLVRDADVAMYRAKQAGKTRYAVFEERMRVEVSERLKLEGDLRRAIERGEFVLHYQPLVVPERSRNRIIGVEALLRWDHPERGLIYPAGFIDLAEETGLIVPIGRWVMKEAFGQVRRWQLQFSSTPPLRSNVNVSGRQFDALTLVEDIALALRESELDPSSATVEITESAAMKVSLSNKATFENLERLGIKIAIDDFGVGYSSLARLGSYPVDILKIDKSLVVDKDSDSEDARLMSAVINIGHAFGLEVIAEGVETTEHLEQLQRLGGNVAQGYYFSKPLPADATETLLAKDTLP